MYLMLSVWSFGRVQVGVCAGSSVKDCNCPLGAGRLVDVSSKTLGFWRMCERGRRQEKKHLPLLSKSIDTMHRNNNGLQEAGRDQARMLFKMKKRMA